MMRRRHFITQTGLASAGAGLAAGQSRKKKSWPIVIFEKPIQTLDYDRMGEELSKMGVQGIEATIRRGGHIEAKDAESEVPGMVKSLAKNGQKALIATCNVNLANEENAKFLRILKANGITRYRMDYFRYDLKKALLPQVAENTAKLREIEAMNREIGMQALYQIHAGAKYAGSLAWDAAMMFEKVNPDHAAIAFDLRHVKAGSGLSFPTALAAMRKHVRSIFVKDARWGGERTTSIKNVPLDTGIVNKKTFDEVRKGHVSMPLSLHMEWGKAPIYPKEIVMDAVAHVGRDVRVLKSWL
ncbi:sugar phosphate isomerase/epimerase [bacterium]|jgi:sugar phosphate isomerase/epimerase|nr:sugar phosphate isomerase/epimerase [bacterium]